MIEMGVFCNAILETDLRPAGREILGLDRVRHFISKDRRTRQLAIDPISRLAIFFANFRAREMKSKPIIPGKVYTLTLLVVELCGQLRWPR